MILSISTFIIAMGVICVGVLLKRHTRRRLKDIDGVSPIMCQDMEKENIINQF